MSALDLAQLAARFRRVWTTSAAPNGAPDGTSSQASGPNGQPPAPDGAPERPWLTAEAYPAPAAADRGPSAPGPSTPPGSVADRPAPEGPSRRLPKRPRWLFPTGPADRAAEPLDPPPAGPHMCPFCDRRHQSVPMHASGLSAAYGATLLPEPGQRRRSTPIGSGPGDTSSLRRAAFAPWSTSPAAEPIPPAMTLRERIAALWYGDVAP